VVTHQSVFFQFVALCNTEVYTSVSEEHIPPVTALKRTIFLIFSVQCSCWPEQICLYFPTVGYHFLCNLCIKSNGAFSIRAIDWFRDNAVDLYSVGTWFES
jgi:hypothetical protein